MVTQPAAQIIASVQVSPDEHLELIRRTQASTELLRWKGGVAETGRQFIIGSDAYVAADVSDGIPREMRLPTGISDYESGMALVDDMTEVLYRLGGARPEEAEKAAFFALATFFTDYSDPALRALITGRDAWEAARFLQPLSCLCRHALLLASFDFSYNFRLPVGCAPTYLLCHPKSSAQLVNFLDASQHDRCLVSRGGQMTNSRFAAVILDSDTSKVEPPNSFLRIDSTPFTRAERFGEDQLREIADEFQSKLLSYRLDQLPPMMRIPNDAADFEGSTRALAGVLASSFAATDSRPGAVA